MLGASLLAIDKQKFPVNKEEEFFSMIMNGSAEVACCKALKIPVEVYLLHLAKDQTFQQKIEECRKHRAELWFSKVAETVNDDVAPEEIPSHKLRFDKLKWLAKVDNPDRFGEKQRAEVTINATIGKALSPLEARQILLDDPFAAKVHHASYQVITPQPAKPEEEETTDESDML